MIYNNQQETEIFSMALNINKPWRIERIEFNEESELHIYIGYIKGTKFECKECGKKCDIHDTKEKTWRHLNFFEHKAYIHCKVPRTKCEAHKVLLIDVPWANSNTGFTMLFEQLVMNLAKKMSILSISRLLKESNGRLWRIVKRYAKEYVESLEFSQVKRIGLDETSKKGHNYLTVFVDLDTSKIMYIADGKKGSTIDEFRDFFIERNGVLENIEAVTCDMNMGYTTGIKKAFKNAKIVYDKFHVIKIINEALDDVRKEELKKEPELKKTKYMWLKNKKNLKENQKDNLEKMCKKNLKTAKGYRLKLAFQDIYNTNYTKDIAKLEIDEWINWALHSKLEPFKKVARTIGRKVNGILNYFENRLTNAILEGTNSMIQYIKTRARGYKNTENFKAMIYLMNSKYSIVG